MDRFENMRVFIKVAETGSISDAAAQIGVVKSALSRRLKELEEHLGVELFHRTTRKMSLTETGSVFYQHATRILDDVAEAESDVTQAHTALKGRLKIALPSTFGIMHMGPAINEFAKTHPDIEFDLDFNDREVDLVHEGFDLAIRIAKLPDSSLIARKLAPIEFVTCASPAYLEQFGIPQSPKDLVNHQCLTYSLLSNDEQWNFKYVDGQNLKIKLKPYLKATTGEYLKDAAVNGLGIVLLPEFIVYQKIKEGSLLSILKDYVTPPINAYAIYPQTRHLSQRVRMFVDFLIKRFSDTPNWSVSNHLIYT